jgi:hypothetical protein
MQDRLAENEALGWRAGGRWGRLQSERQAAVADLL